MLNIEEPKHGMAAFWSKAFRVFFAAAVGYAVVNMLFWLLTLGQLWTINAGYLSIYEWHAHELLWGYGGAVIAGFLLTAVGNWTGRPTASPKVLQLMLGAWLLARTGWLIGGSWLWLAVLADSAYLALLGGIFIQPIAATKQWRQGGIISKLVLLLVGHLMVSASALGLVANTQQWAKGGVYLGLFITIALLLTLLRRIYPFFVRAASGGKVDLATPVWIDRWSMILFLLFFLAFFAGPDHLVMPIAAAALTMVLGIRLVSWHDASIWRAPLLWSLYLGLAMITLGCALFALSYWHIPLRFVAVHSWTMGGFGLVTLGMMLRVSLGHTGRNVR
ncbi:MAG: NnrS family protein, partial [Gammaproteobacteria bacterium]|nr:NnrS family protein [Gammaproteobacteria bacterium]